MGNLLSSSRKCKQEQNRLTRESTFYYDTHGQTQLEQEQKEEEKKIQKNTDPTSLSLSFFLFWKSPNKKKKIFQFF